MLKAKFEGEPYIFCPNGFRHKQLEHGATACRYIEDLKHNETYSVWCVHGEACQMWAAKANRAMEALK